MILIMKTLLKAALLIILISIFSNLGLFQFRIWAIVILFSFASILIEKAWEE